MNENNWRNNSSLTGFCSFMVLLTGVICAFSNRASFRYINEVLDKQIFNNLEFKNDIDNLHIILVNDIDTNNEKMDLNDLNLLREEAQQLAERFAKYFIK